MVMEEVLIQYGALGMFCLYLILQNKTFWATMREEHEITRQVIDKNTLTLGKVSNAPCLKNEKL